MIEQILTGLGHISGLLPLTAQATSTILNTSTLGAAIDTVNITFYDYFTVLLQKYWPFVVGAGILVLVWHFGRRLLNAFN